MADTEAPPPITYQDGVNLASAVDSGKVDVKSLSPQGQLAYAVIKGQVDPKQLNQTGMEIYNALQPPKHETPNTMDQHPILDTVEKTAELGGLVGGGMMGAGAGALTSPVTGPVGPIAGGIAGAGLAYGAVKQGAHAVNAMIGYEPSGSLGDETKNTIKGVKEGAEMQAMGEGIGAAASGALKALPAAMDFMSSMSQRVAGKVLENPEILTANKGTEESVVNAVENVQKTLSDFKTKASEVYNKALQDAGVRAPQTAETHAQNLMDGSTKAWNLDKIGQKYLELKEAVKDDLDPTWILKQAEELKQNINAHLKFNNSSVSLEPIKTDASAHLNAVKTDLMNVMRDLPGGKQVLDASENWAKMHDVYDQLQGSLKDTGKAVETMKKVFTDDSSYYQSVRDALQKVDQVTGAGAAQKLENEVISHIAGQSLPKNVMGKRQIVMAVSLMAPGRMVTAPALLAAQSPALMSKAGLAGQAALRTMATPGVAPALLGGAAQVASGPSVPPQGPRSLLSEPVHSNLMQRQ